MQQGNQDSVFGCPKGKNCYEAFDSSPHSSQVGSFPSMGELLKVCPYQI